MTWFRVGGGGSGIPAALKNRMNAVLNKKFGTAVDYPANGWPDDVNLLGLLEEKTVSGSVVSFDDGANDVPCKNVVATIAPTIDGVSIATATQTGRNIADVSAATKASEQRCSYVFENGGLTITATGNYARVGFAIPCIQGATYTLSYKGSSDAQYKRVLLYPSELWSSSFYAQTLTDTETAYSTTFTAQSDHIYIGFYLTTSGTTGTETIKDIQIELGSTVHDYERYQTPTQYSAQLGRTIYGGQVDFVTGEGVDENGNDFTFDGQEVNTRPGYNAFWSEQGDSSVTYRSGGTLTPYVPTLISKSITANGTYRAIDDQATGFSEVVVNVPHPTASADPIMSANAFVTKSGVSGTDVSTVARSFTMSAAGTLVFASGSYGFTNTGSNDGFFEIQKNGVSVVKQYCNTSTNTPITIPNISVEENDVVDLVVGFDNAHSSCNFQFYSAMVVLSEV